MGGGGMRAAAGCAPARPAPPTPELMAAIESLPPVRDWPARGPCAADGAGRGGSSTSGAICGRSYLQLALGAMFIVLDSACLLAGPQFVRYTINNAIEQHDGQLLLVLICLYFAVNLVDWFFQWREIFLTGRVGERLLFGLRVKIFSHLQRLGMDFYDREMGGRILTRIGSDVDTLSQLMQSGLVNAFVSFVNFFGVAVLIDSHESPACLVRPAGRPAAARRARCCTGRSRRRPTTASENGSRRSTPISRRTSPASGSPRPSGGKSATRRTSRTLTLRLPRRRCPLELLPVAVTFPSPS